MTNTHKSGLAILGGRGSVPSPRRSATISRRHALVGAGAALAAVGVSTIANAPLLALARQGTPVAPSSPEMAAFFVQFIHFDKVLASFGVVLDDEQLAALYGLDAPAYRGLRDQFAASALQAAHELLADVDFANRVDRLPFAAGDTVVALGDSITDDLQSWAEILRHLLDLRRGADRIKVVNQGISGDTTADALRRIVPILAAQPSWIIGMLGTNDVQRNGVQATKMLVSLDEITRNLAELRHLAATESSAQWVWITAPPCDEERIAANPFWAQAEIVIHNDDLVAIADLLRDKPDPVVDLMTLFGQPPAAGLLGDDGVHPTLAGQQAIARALVERLTETE